MPAVKHRPSIRGSTRGVYRKSLFADKNNTLLYLMDIS